MTKNGFVQGQNIYNQGKPGEKQIEKKVWPCTFWWAHGTLTDHTHIPHNKDGRQKTDEKQ